MIRAKLPTLRLVMTLLIVAAASAPVALADDACTGAADVPDQACVLTDGAQTSGYLQTSGAANFYFFSAPEPDTAITIQLTNLPAQYQLALFSPTAAHNDPPLALVGGDDTDPHQISLTLQTGGPYLVEVACNASRPADPDNAYLLTVQITPPSPKAPAASDDGWDQKVQGALSAPIGLSLIQHQIVDNPNLDQTEKASLTTQFQLSNYKERLDLVTTMDRLHAVLVALPTPTPHIP